MCLEIEGSRNLCWVGIVKKKKKYPNMLVDYIVKYWLKSDRPTKEANKE